MARKKESKDERDWTEVVAERRTKVAAKTAVPKSLFGSLADRFKVFTARDEDGRVVPLDRDDIIAMIRYRSEVEAAGDVKGPFTKWINEYDCNPNHEQRYEAYCYLAGVSPDELYGLIDGEYRRICKQGASGKLAAGLPDVIDAVLDFAQLPENGKDREIAVKMSEMPGMQPASINISQNVQVNSFAAAGIPKFETAQAKMTKNVLKETKTLMLEAMKEDASAIDAVVERETVNAQ